jgi:hypothetical protein
MLDKSALQRKDANGNGRIVCHVCNTKHFLFIVCLSQDAFLYAMQRERPYE